MWCNGLLEEFTQSGSALSCRRPIHRKTSQLTSRKLERKIRGLSTSTNGNQLSTRIPGIERSATWNAILKSLTSVRGRRFDFEIEFRNSHSIATVMPMFLWFQTPTKGLGFLYFVSWTDETRSKPGETSPNKKIWLVNWDVFRRTISQSGSFKEKTYFLALWSLTGYMSWWNGHIIPGWCY